MSRSAWRTGTTWGLAAGAVTAWLATPWVSMAVRGTLDSRRADHLRAEGGPGADGHGVAATGRIHLLPASTGHVPDHTPDRRPLAAVPGPRPRALGRSRATS